MKTYDTRNPQPVTLQEGEVVRVVADDIDGLFRVSAEPVETPEGAWRYTLAPVDEVTE